MPRTLLVLVSLVLMATLACGGGNGSRMTVQEYASACTSLGDSFQNLDGGFNQDVSTGFEALEDALFEIKDWNPPEELQELHNLRIRSLESSLDALQETGLLQLMQDIEEATEEGDDERFRELMGDVQEIEGKLGEFEAQAAELEEEIQLAENELSPPTREILVSAGCL